MAFLDYKWINIAIKSSMALVSLYLFIREIKILFKYFVFHMLNMPTPFFVKEKERPRILAYLIFGSLNLVLLYQIIYFSANSEVIYVASLFLLILVFLSLSYVLHFTWDPRFQKTVGKAQRSISKFQDNKSDLPPATEEELELIFDNLLNFDFIEVEGRPHDSKDKTRFSKMLLGEFPKEKLFKLKMDNIQTKYFSDLLSKRVRNFNLDLLLRMAQNKNRNATRSTIESSFSKAKSNPKKHLEIKKCFDLKNFEQIG